MIATATLNRTYLEEEYGGGGNKKLTCLNEIELDYKRNKSNRLFTRLDALTFKYLTNLQRISLTNHRLDTLEESTFANLTNLKHVNLCRNQIKHFADNVGCLFFNSTNLIDLDLACNRIEQLPAHIFSGLVHLKYIDLADNCLSRVEPGVFNGLVSLEEINLEKNKINKLERNQFGQLKQLQSIYLSHNQIKKIDQFVFKGVEGLENVDLSQNKIESMDKETFQGLSKLKCIKLDGNVLWESSSKLVPVMLLLESSVNFVSVKSDSSNDIELFTASKQEKKRNSSEQLVITRDYLLEKYHGNHAIKIELTRRSNEKKIIKIERDAFKDFDRLEDIVIRNHHIDTIETGTFANMPTLRRVALVNNKIKRLETKVFSGSKNLEEIDLSRNKLSHNLMDALDKDTFYNLKRLKIIELNSRISWIYNDDKQSEEIENIESDNKQRLVSSFNSNDYHQRRHLCKKKKKDFIQIILRAILLMTQLVCLMLMLFSFQECCHMVYSIKSENLNRIWLGILIGLLLLISSVGVLYFEITIRCDFNSKANIAVGIAVDVAWTVGFVCWLLFNKIIEMLKEKNSFNGKSFYKNMSLGAILIGFLTIAFTLATITSNLYRIIKLHSVHSRQHHHHHHHYKFIQQQPSINI